MSGSRIASSELGATATVRRGLALSPEFRKGLGITLLLALLTTAGRVVVPIAVQQVTDNGILAEGGPDAGFVLTVILVSAAVIAITSTSAFFMNVRLFTAAESGLATLRNTAFRHIHDLAVLTQSTERRGALVSRVTTDVDTISQFIQFGGVMLLVSFGQILLATVLMLVYSPLLAAVVYLCLLPLLLMVRWFQPILARAYGDVRQKVGDMLGSISESIVGATTIRAYGVEERTAERMDVAIERHRRSAIRAQARSVLAFVGGQVFNGVTTAAVLVVGTILAVNGSISLGELLAFLFLVNLFTQPVVMATEIFNELQNAIAGWRRVIGVIDTPADVADPGESGITQGRGPMRVTFEDVGYTYPGTEAPVLSDVHLVLHPRTKVAIVGETGSGKTTLAKLLTRMMDPVEGVVRIDGDDLRAIRFSSLRRRMVMVPQEGFLFDSSLLENVRYGRPEADDAAVDLALTELGLRGWVDGLPQGVHTPVGQRGESLSAGERQLVAIARAYLADPDLLVLDEATSAVDPGTEVRIQRALEGLTAGRTAVSIAHRLSTAEAADVVVVMDAGRIVEHGHHRDLVHAGGVYSRMHASWSSQQRQSSPEPT